jgi:hypothetical protein
MKKIILLLLASAMFYTIAHADCWDSGTLYPTGTTKNGRVCQDDGTWK